MQLYKNNSQRYRAGLVYIFLIYTISSLFFFGHFLNWKFKTPELLNHVLLFGMAVLVYWIGTVQLGKLQEIWMLFIWHFVYISSLSILLVIILVKLLFVTISFTIRPIHLTDTINFILISPMLYFLLGSLNRLLFTEQNNK